MDHLQEKHIKTLITLHEVKDYSKDDQFAVLLSALQDYSILHKLRAIVGDNANTNDTLCRAVEKYLLEEGNLK